METPVFIASMLCNRCDRGIYKEPHILSVGDLHFKVCKKCFLEFQSMNKETQITQAIEIKKKLFYEK